MGIPLSVENSEGFYSNIRLQYFKILTSKNIIESEKKKELYKIIGNTIKDYRKLKSNIPHLEAMKESIIKYGENTLKLIQTYSETNENIQNNSKIIRENQKSLDKNLKEIEKGVKQRIELEERSKNNLTKGNLGKN